MQKFRLVHEYPLLPADFIGLVDNLAFRSHLIEQLGSVRMSERLAYEESPSERRKTIRVYPDMHLPQWIERAIKDREPHFDMHYQLDKRTFVEKFSGESGIGRVEGTITYRRDGERSTTRLFDGSFHCSARIVGRAIEKFYVARMTQMYDDEARFTREYIASGQCQTRASSATEDSP